VRERFVTPTEQAVRRTRGAIMPATFRFQAAHSSPVDPSEPGSATSRTDRRPRGGRRLALAVAVAAAAVVPAAVLTASPALAAESCTNQFTGMDANATLTGSNGPNILDPGAGAVVAALAGNDVVRVTPGVPGLVVCLGDGADQLVGLGGTPNLAISAMAGPGDDLVFGSSANDALNGGSGYDTVNAGAGYDVCRNFEVTTGCEVIL
jgi:hemolysin type calcium-binding protein